MATFDNDQNETPGERPDRRPIQRQHERAVVSSFVDWLNERRGTRYNVIAEPDPPEAIIRSVRVTRWIEVVDAVFSGEYARDLYSDATPGERHVPIVPGPYLEPDETFAKNFVAVVAKKLSKRSYLPFLEKYGPGYLVVSVHYPLFDDQTIRRARILWSERKRRTDLGCFRDVFYENRRSDGPPFRRWRT